jgi:branched-chain amino acid transport system substrate-binding protein
MVTRRALIGGLAILPAFSRFAFAADTIKIGVIVPLSGGAGRQGQDVTNSIEAMASLINADGGVMGKQVEILARDDESTPAIGIAKANELIAAGVAVVIEGWNSPVTLAMQAVLARANVLDITMISKADSILTSATNPLALRLNSANSQDAAIIAKYLGGKMKSGRVVFVTENDAYGNGAQKGIEEEFKKANLDYTIAATLKFPFPQTDFRIEITSIRDAKPDVVISINANEGAGLPAFLQQYAQANIGAPVLCSVGTVSPSVIEAAGPAANGLTSADIYFPYAEPFASIPESKRFAAETVKQFKTPPDKFGALGAASLQIWAKAVAKVNSLDRAAVAGAIRGQEIAGTIFGTVRFDAHGQMNQRYGVFTVKDGKIVVLSS